MVGTGVVAPLIGAEAVERIELPAASPPLERDRDFGRYQVIGKRELFHTTSVELEPAVMPEEEIRDTSLRHWQLQGTIVMEPAESSVATLQNNRNRSLSGAYREGDQLERGVELVRVERRQVRILNNGVIEKIAMEEDGAGGPTARRVTQGRGRGERVSAGARRRPPRQRADRKLGALTRRAAKPSAPPRAAPVPEIPDDIDPEVIRERMQAFAEVAEAMGQIQDEDGLLTGLEVQRDLASDSIVGAMPTGTVCNEINGVPLTQMHVAVQAMNSGEEVCMRCTLPDGTEKVSCF